MLNEVLHVVQQQGWFDTRQPYEKAIYLSQGASLWMILTRRGQPQLFVKFSRLVSLETEAQRFARASLAHPEHAPRFVGYIRHGELHVMATGAVDFRAVTIDMVARPAAAERLRQALAAYFTGAAEPVASHAWAQEVERYFQAQATQPPVATGLCRLRAALPSLPARPQHGDLVLNNLGLRPDGRLIVFDWEDYGEVALPGLDLFTLEMSLQEAAQQQGTRGRVDTAPALDIDGWCASQGISPAQHRELRLCHALVFRYLKRKYGPEIQARLDALIAAL
ncbi:MAG TPA: phosphotransferase [Rubrivivax sp.]|nr:phosphotransferase [Rubrivivax sp.]